MTHLHRIYPYFDCFAAKLVVKKHFLGKLTLNFDVKSFIMSIFDGNFTKYRLVQSILF